MPSHNTELSTPATLTAADGGGAGTAGRLGPAGAAGRLGPAGAAVAAAGLAVNGLAYLVPMLGARTLPADELGALAAVLALGAIAAVPALGLQAALAVRWAKQGVVPNANQIAGRTAAVTGAVLALSVPVVAVTLHVPLVLAVTLMVSTVAIVLAGRWLGELQGAQRFGWLAAAMVLVALGRYGGVTTGLALGGGATEALVVGAGSAWLVPPAVALVARRARRGGTASASSGLLRGRDIVSASSATLVMLVISYADLVIARHLLPVAQSGAYAVGAVLTKGALWAPHVVTVLALPRLAQGSRRALAVALGVVAACGLVIVGVAWSAGGLVVRLVAGDGYPGVAPYAAGFAVVGALYALVFVLVNAEIAAGVRWPGAPLWCALVVLGGVAWSLHPPTLGGILTVAALTATLAVAGMGLLVGLRPDGRKGALYPGKRQ